MNWVHIHLITNHAPVVGVFIGLVILGYGMYRASDDLKRFSLIYLVGLGAITALVFLTGEPAEEAIDHLPGISESVIERHENASMYGLIVVEITALFAFLGLSMQKFRLQQKTWFYKTVLTLVLIACVTMGWIGNLGGKIRHSEITQNTETAQSGSDG